VSEFMEITLKLPIVDSYEGTDPMVPALACRRCRCEFTGERIAKFDRSWFCLDCIAKLPAELVTRSAWVTIADHVAERPSQQTAATIRATLQNLAAMTRGAWR
jgi:hypothetical protein